MALLRRPIDDRPAVWLVGDAAHVEFVEAIDLLHATARVAHVASLRNTDSRQSDDLPPPELIVLAQSRPGTIEIEAFERLRRRAPLAGIVALLGTWCEGEARTGRPPAGVWRSYWYEFPTWWRRQIALRSAGRCPDWARLDDFGLRIADCGMKRLERGLVAIDATCWDTADALADMLRRAGFTTARLPAGHAGLELSGVVAGVWEGRQLGGDEVRRLASFCGGLSADGAPVITLLDFPRRDSCEAARAAGAQAVLGKPWVNADLLATLTRAIERRHELPRAA